jgi:hypothetical protein
MRQPFGGTIDTTIASSKPWWPQALKPPAGAPNILMVLLDDLDPAEAENVEAGAVGVIFALEEGDLVSDD